MIEYKGLCNISADYWVGLGLGDWERAVVAEQRGQLTQQTGTTNLLLLRLELEREDGDVYVR